VIQNFLRKHDNSVVIYPKSGIASGSGHAGLVWEFFRKNWTRGNDRDSRPGPSPGRKELLKELSSETKSSKRDILISSETLGKPYGSCKDVGAFVRAVVPLVSTSRLEIEVLIACREHFSWAASIYNQTVKNKHSGEPELRDPDEFLLCSAAGFQYASVIRKLQKTGFKVTVLNYHPSDNWFKRFLNHVGFPDSQIPPPQIRNASLSIPMLIAKLAANRVLKAEYERRKFTRTLRETHSAKPGSLSIFGKGASADAERWFRADRQYLWDEFGIQFPRSENCQSAFFIDGDGMAEIAAAVEGLGSAAHAILEIAKQYQRT
jgi:hypothetical protein